MENPRNQQLIAYLDGELDPGASREVEERLKHDAQLRRELTLYERSWDMLDQLERSTVGEAFTRSTLQMISLAAGQEPPAARTWRRPKLGQIGMLALAVLVALAAGYVGGRAVWPDPNRQLLDDLPILEDLGMYVDAGSIDFLRKLGRKDQSFHGDVAAEKMPGLAVPDSRSERRGEIDRMGPVERKHLMHRLDRFSEYSVGRQQQLRALHASLNHDSDGPDLRNVLVHYHEWLDTLLPADRQELDELTSDDERIARIEQIKEERAKRRSEEHQEGPSEQDLTVVAAWLDDFSWQHRDRLLGSLSDKRRSYLGKLQEPQLHHALVWMMQHRGGGPNRWPAIKPSQSDLERLAAQLSRAARDQLDAATGLPDKNKVIHEWVQTAMRHQAESGGLLRMLPPITFRELQRFNDEELTAEQRDGFAGVNRTRKFRQLFGLYFLPVARLAEVTPLEIADGFPVRPGTGHHPSDGPPHAGPAHAGPRHGGPKPDGPPRDDPRP